jgi:hypothetical protein
VLRGKAWPRVSDNRWHFIHEAGVIQPLVAAMRKPTPSAILFQFGLRRLY